MSKSVSTIKKGTENSFDSLKEERKQKREERRAKQRENNVLRAKKMHAYRLSIDFVSQNKKIITTKNPSSQNKFNIGCSGWFYWHWNGQFYPEELPRNQWFAHYKKNFQTVELNAPFYSWPTLATIKSWQKQVGRHKFVYTVKVSELITHTKRFKGTKELIKDFTIIADILGARMGCFLFQLPPSFHFTPARLKSIIAQLDPNLRNVVEFRHSSWWNDTVFKAFKEARIIFCSCSGPRLPDQLVKTADDIYIRFHGKKQWYRHDYSEEELKGWAERIKKSRAKRIWAYFNNDRDAFAIKNARMLIQLLKE